MAYALEILSEGRNEQSSQSCSKSGKDSFTGPSFCSWYGGGFLEKAELDQPGHLVFSCCPSLDSLSQVFIIQDTGST